MKATEIQEQNMDQGYDDYAMAADMDLPSQKSKALTAENLKAASVASSKKPGKKGAKGKPAWA